MFALFVNKKCMNSYRYILVIDLIVLTFGPSAQNNGVIHGKVFSKTTNELALFANIINIDTTTYIDGNYSISGLTPGYSDLRVSSVGFKTLFQRQY